MTITRRTKLMMDGARFKSLEGASYTGLFDLTFYFIYSPRV